MDKTIILYTIGCSKCKALARALKGAGFEYTTCTDIQTMMDKGIKSAPTLEVGEKLMSYDAALDWIRSQNEAKYL